MDSQARSRETRLLRAGIAAFAAVVALWVVYWALTKPHGALDPVDLTVYRDGGLIVRGVAPYYDPHYGAPLYDWGGYSSVALKFTYTPFAAIAFALVSFIPLSQLIALSVVVNMAALLAALWFTFGALGYEGRRRAAATLLASAAVLWAQPVLRTIYLGQINLILMAGIIWDMCQPREGRWWKGFVTGIAAGIKLVPLIFVPYLVLTRRFREAAMTCAGFAFTVAVGFAVLPSDSSDWWLHGVFLQSDRAGFMGWAGNQSLNGLITRLAGSVAGARTAWAVAFAITVVIGILVAARLDRAGHRMPAILMTALTGLLASPISWDHHWVWIAPGFAVAAHYAARSWRTARRLAWSFVALAAGILVVFGTWPDAMWEKARNLGQFSLGFLWAPPNTDPVIFAKLGDQPWYVEYHWHGLWLLTGNAYLLGGIVIFLILLGVSLYLRLPGPAAASGDPEEVPAGVAGGQ